MLYQTTYQTPFNTLTLYSDGKSIKGVGMANSKVEKIFANEEIKTKDELNVFKETKKWLDDYFAKKQPDINKLKLALDGTSYQKLVWQKLLEIPYGSTTNYKEITEKINQQQDHKTSPRAVGNAIAFNPALVLVPCHRVVGSDNSLTGYSGGLAIKV